MASADSVPIVGPLDRIEVEPWPTERPLFVLGVVIGVIVWAALAITVIGLLYALLIAAVFFVAHVVFVAHVRGNAVRLGPEQFPELYDRARQLAARMGMTKTPEVYLMQAGGALNAFATRFLMSNIVVLFSDLLEACGDNTAARDMIIAHELGHVRRGHLRLRWLLLPFSVIPFLGTALSRAREYTCDRYGLAGAGDRDGALLGLTILAAGAKHGPKVNTRVLARQRADLNKGWMTIGEWLSTHPPLAKRVIALEPSLAGEPASAAGPLRALAVMASVVIALVGGAWLTILGARTALGGLFSSPFAAFEQLGVQEEAAAPDESSADEAALVPGFPMEGEAASRALQQAFDAIAAFIAEEVAAGRGVPVDADDLKQRWDAVRSEPMPVDPYDGLDLSYRVTDTGYVLISSGPDHEFGTDDDIAFERSGAEPSTAR